MEDAATAEISRAQVWQWVHHRRARWPTARRSPPSWSAGCLDEPQVDALVAEGGYDADRARPTPARSSSRWPWPTTSPTFLTLPAYELLP